MHGYELTKVSEELKKTLVEFEDIADKYSKCNISKSIYSDLTKQLLAAKIQEKRGDGKLSEAKLENIARADPNYLEQLRNKQKAFYESEKYRILYDSYKTRIDSLRTQVSLLKAQVESFGG